MLILMRRPRERFNIGDDIVVEVISSFNGQVRIGIQAPRSLPVHREEVYERIQRENATDNGSNRRR